MLITKEVILREIKILALFMGVSLIQTYLMCRGCSSWRSYNIVYVFTVLMWIFLWRGNNILTDFISARISWLHFPVKRFVVGLATTILYTLFVAFFLITLIQKAFNFNFGGSYDLTIYISVVFTLLISLFLHSREFLQHWRKAALEAEKFQREKLSAQYENLKSRVNPQLLFNSLRTLRGLTVTNKEQAVKFIKNLSDVYRYILDTRDKELVPDSQEIKFLNSFIYLLKSRFDRAIEVNVNFSGKPFFVSPLSIQMILEAIIDNSDFGDQNPLIIGIREEDVSILIDVKNHRRTENAANILEDLLQNISARYRFLVESPVLFEMKANSLTVRLPQVSMSN